VNEEDLVNSAGCGVFYIGPVSASGATRWKAPQSKAGQKQTGQESHMNVRTITSFILAVGFILAVALMASAAGVYAAEQSGHGDPYTGPDTPVMTAA
jgi:hypothetical protein